MYIFTYISAWLRYLSSFRCGCQENGAIFFRAAASDFLGPIALCEAPLGEHFSHFERKKEEKNATTMV